MSNPFPLIDVESNQGIYHARLATYMDRFGSGYVHADVFTSDVVETPVVTLYTKGQWSPEKIIIRGDLNDLEKLRNALTELLEEFGRY